MSESSIQVSFPQQNPPIDADPDIDPLQEWMVVIWRWYAHQNPHW